MPKLTEHEPNEGTQLFVREMTAYGITPDIIAGRLNITIPTLYSMYKEEIRHASAELMRQLGNSLVRQATNPKGGQPAVTAAIYLTKVLSRHGKALGIMENEWDDGFRTGKQEERLTKPTANYNVLPDNGRGPRLIEHKKK